MRWTLRRLPGLLLVMLATVLLAGNLPALAAGTAQGSIPSAVPGKTPHVLDGKTSSGDSYRVLDIAQVGTRIVVAGQFDQVQNPGSGGAPSGTIYRRANLFAFDASTGLVDTAFAPAVNGTVNAVEPGPNNTVYIGGQFSTVNGATVRRVAQLNLADGRATSGFRTPSINAAVEDVALWGGRLFIAGTFSTVNGVAHSGLASLNATTGALDPYLSLDVAGHHNYGVRAGSAQAPVGVTKIDISPVAGRMIAIGNFRTVGGVSRDQVASVLLQSGGAVVDRNWQTTRYQDPCKSRAFDSWVRDLQWSPDGSYFVIVSTGAYYANTLCDTAARFDASATGLSVQPSWISYTGGDSLFSVAVTDTAVYVGGHQRWGNNPFAGDRAGAGAVPRPGLAALDPLSGIPLSWNPGRNPRGYGATAMLATSRGLYVGSDTNWIGNYHYPRRKLAFFPLAGGKPPASQNTGSLAADPVYLGGRPGGGNAVVKRSYNGTSWSTDSAAPAGGPAWSQARGAFMAGNTLYYGIPDGSGAYELARRSFDGNTFGPQQILDTPYKDPAWDGVATGSGNTYDGIFPNFYGSELKSVTGMFYANGRLYYAKTGSSALFYRGFSVDSGIVGAQSFTAASSGFGSAGGMFVDRGSLYVADRTNGNLSRMAFNGMAPTGSASLISGPGRDGRDWRANAVFIGAAGTARAAMPPSASFTASCSSSLTCSFDASGSTDPNGSPLTYAWSFGDGSSAAQATSPAVSHTYGAARTYTVQLTVSDGLGASDTVSRSVDVSGAAAQGIAWRAAAAASTPHGGTSISVTVPSVRAGDGMVLILSNNSGSTPAGVTGTAPGFTQVGVQTAPVTGTRNVAMTTQVFEKVATGGESGSRLTVRLSAGAKSTLQLLVYSGTSAAGPVRSVTGASDSGGTTHSTPNATASAGDWVLSVWSDKDSDVRTWSAPSGASVRSNLGATGTNGEIATLAGDAGRQVTSTGQVAGLRATVPGSSAKATMLTVVIAGV